MEGKNLPFDEESGNEESIYLQEDEYEVEDTLSFCDLPIYSSDSSQCTDGFPKEDGESLSSGNNDGDGDGYDFEFFSEEFTASTPANEEKKSIIFCGKIIPYKEDSQKAWKFKGSPKLQRKAENDSTFPYSLKKTKPYSAGKVSLTRHGTKSRWFLFMFGISRLPTEMELGDIRSRHNRKVKAAKMFPVAEQGEAVKSRGKKNGRGWERVLRLLGAVRKSKHSNDVVKRSFVGA